MQQPIVLQDWVTLRGAGGATPVTLVPHRRNWLWTGGARVAVVVIEVRELDGDTGAITLRLEGSASETGKWFTVAEWTAPGEHRLFLVRDPEFAADEQLMGYIRWALVEATGPATGEWKACFRITVVLEPA